MFIIAEAVVDFESVQRSRPVSRSMSDSFQASESPGARAFPGIHLGRDSRIPLDQPIISTHERRSTLNKPAVALLEWEPRFSVNVAEIDREHQGWVALINGVYKAVLDGAGKEILNTVLAETTQYGFSHFAHEEKLMDEIDYPEREEHILEHEHLAQETRAFADRLESGDCATVLEYLVFLSDWLKEHTTTTDRRLGKFIQVQHLERRAV